MLMVLALPAAAAQAVCTVRPNVDRHLLRPAMDAALQPTLGWTLSPGCGEAAQTAFRVELCPPGGAGACSSVLVHSNQSDAVPWATWMGAGVALRPSLAEGTTYTVKVALTLDRGQLAWSEPVRFHTQLDHASYAGSAPMWAPNASAQFVMLRRQLPKPKTGEEVYLSVAAKPSPDWSLPHGRNVSHLLGAYKLWVNGVPLGAGPGRSVGGAIPVDTFNLTSLLASGPAVVAIESYYLSSKGSDPKGGTTDADDRGGVVAIFTDGNNQSIPSASGGGWEAMDATAAFGPSVGQDKHGSGTGSYLQPHENIDGRLYPHGWREPGFRGKWSAAATRPAFVSGLAAKEALPVSLRDNPAKSFRILTQSPAHTNADQDPGSADGGTTYRYVVDFGRNFQGHVNISFGSSGTRGQKVTVRLGEQLLVNGSVKYKAESNNHWEDVWTLGGGGAGEDIFVPHEYSEFRWAEVIGAPEPPSHARVTGWQVHYPFDGDLNEEPSSSGSSAAAPMDGLTTFKVLPDPDPLNGSEASGDELPLQKVWELVKHTINAAALDLNTDSNTRQRDLCALDAWLATRYQAGVAPATSCHLRRRATQSLFEPNGYVNFWTEFLIAHVGALYEYTTEYAATEQSPIYNLGSKLWNARVTSMGNMSGGRSPSIGMANYSLLAYYDATDSLVHNTPKPLVDWPRSSGIDTDGKTAGHCNKLCAQMNSYAVLAQEWMAGITSRVSVTAGCPASTPIEYEARGKAIRAAAHHTFATSDCRFVYANLAFSHPTSLPSLSLSFSLLKLIKKYLDRSLVGPTQPTDTLLLVIDDTNTPTAAAAAKKAQALAATAQAGGLMCYSDEPVDAEAPPYTSITATALAAMARLPGSAASVLELVPFLNERNSRRGAAHGHEGSGWIMGFMMEGIYAAAGEVTEGCVQRHQ